MDYEFRLCGLNFKTADHCIVTDTLAMARRLFPGKRNNLDALCERYEIDNSHRTLHGALLDAEILAEVYLAMTGGQTTLAFSAEDNPSAILNNTVKKIERNGTRLSVIKANETELSAHESILEKIDKKSGGALWKVH